MHRLTRRYSLVGLRPTQLYLRADHSIFLLVQPSELGWVITRRYGLVVGLRPTTIPSVDGTALRAGLINWHSAYASLTLGENTLRV